jgi:general nucleoside transport system permease protein
MDPFLSSIASPQFLFAIIRVTTPLLFAAIGVAITALSGSINIGLEGIMLVSAFTGVIISGYTGNLFLALLGGVLVGIGLGAVLGYFHLKLKTDIIIAAIALNLFASGITVLLLYILTNDKGTSSSLTSQVFPAVELPLINDIPVLGEIISGHNILSYFAIFSVFVFYWLIYKTRLGLRIRAVGQNPDAAASVGIDVNRIKLYSIVISGFFGSLGGLYLSMGYVSWFSRDMTAGRGFIAIAAAALGSNLPLGTSIGALFFGLINTIAIYIAPSGIPSEFVFALPYVVTIITLTMYSIGVNRKTSVRNGEMSRRGKSAVQPASQLIWDSDQEDTHGTKQ